MHLGLDARFLCRTLRGMPTYVYHLSYWLPRLKPEWKFTFFINRGFEHNDRPDAIDKRLEIFSGLNNIETINQNNDADIQWEQLIFPKLAKKADVDLIHLPGNRCLFNTKIPQVSTFHDIMEYLFLKDIVPINDNDPWHLKLYLYRKRLYVHYIYRMGIKNPRRLITVSSYTANDVHKNLGIPLDRINVIHHGIDEDFRIDSNQLKTIGLESRTHCLMLGADGYQKNPRGALQAWSLVRPEIRHRFPLKIYGFTGNSGSPLIKALKEFGLEKEVELRQWVSKEELIDGFRTAAVFIFLSLYEGFGIPLLQAMASGTPCLHSNTSSLIEISQGTGMSVHPTDPQKAAIALEKLLENEDDWKKTAYDAWNVATKFTWERSASLHLKVYEEAMNL